jgi:tRNA-dihydrouridine synthase A
MGKSTMENGGKIISVAPMMDWTDRHCRYFHRLIAPSVWLYTEMVTTGALTHGDAERFLRYDKAEHPIVLQLGGSDPTELAGSAKMGEEAGYDEINLNCGCPSDRVQSGSFGACLMKEPGLVAECISAMREAVSVPVTVKCRIGIDDSEEYDFLHNFVETVGDKGGCPTFIIHARKAWLKGLSPKENREIPPLRYDIVARLKDSFPALSIQLNGGIKTLEDIKAHLETFDGVMIGREAYQNPWFLREIEESLYQTSDLLSEQEIVTGMAEYAAQQWEKHETPVKAVTRHMTGLFQGRPGARRWRQILSTQAHEKGADASIITRAYEEAF